MRVITGSARGMALKAPKGMDTRPTMDQVKEGIFSAIQFEVEGRRVLDLFAGSGQMGIEALSRGAKSAVFVDMREDACKVVRENLAKTRLEQNAREQSRVVDLAAKTGAVDAVAAKLGQLADEREELEASLAEMELSCAMVDEERAEFWVRRLMGRSDPLEAVRLFVDRVVLDREAGEMRVAFSFDGIKKNPHQAESDGGSRNCRLAEKQGFEPWIPLWGILT